MPDIDSFIQYFISYDVANFFHIAVSEITETGFWYLCTLVGIKLGYSILNSVINN